MGQSGGAGGHAQRSDIAMSGLKKKSSTKQHNRISIQPTDGFRRLDDETKTVEWKTHFTSRSNTPVLEQAEGGGKKQGIKIITDIVVQRD